MRDLEGAANQRRTKDRFPKVRGQMIVGEFQYRMYGTIPWWVVLIHVALAASLFAWTVGLVARVWRPAS